MPGSYLVAGARTPIGKLSGALSPLSAADLGGVAIAAALERAGVAADDVDHVVVGQVLMAGQGQVPSRQAAVKAGIPMRVPAVNVNKVCLSGLNAIYLADQMIAAGEADVVVAAGIESMTNAPYLADGARLGFRYGNTELRDSIIADGLWCAFDACLMGLGTERYTAGSISRDDQDAFAALSHERAAAAIKEGRLAEEIAPVSIAQRRGDPIVVEHDEGVRPETTVESLGALRPAFDPQGTVTAGNASQLSDGASADRADVEGRGRAPGRRRRSASSCPTGWSPVPTRRRCCTSRAGRSRPRWLASGWRSATSTCSRSTRRSLPSGWRRWPTSASRRTSSTSTVGRSPSVTRSG